MPESACVKPSSTRMSVVFPAPFGPRYPKAQPRGTRSSTPFTATFSPKRFVSPWVSTAQRLSAAWLSDLSGSVAVLTGQCCRHTLVRRRAWPPFQVRWTVVGGCCVLGAGAERQRTTSGQGNAAPEASGDAGLAFVTFRSSKFCS